MPTPQRDISGAAIAALLGGGLLVYASVKNIPIAKALNSLLKGKVPETAGQLNTPGAPGSVITTPPGEHSGPGQAGVNQSLGRALATPFGWSSGNEWQSLLNLWDRESGWQSNIMNPQSGAFGIAQALGHGNAQSQASNVSVNIAGQGPSVQNVNMYPSLLANQGDPTSQIIWGLQYIQSTYGSPSAAWAHEQQFGWY